VPWAKTVLLRSGGSGALASSSHGSSRWCFSRDYVWLECPPVAGASWTTTSCSAAMAKKAVAFDRENTLPSSVMEDFTPETSFSLPQIGSSSPRQKMPLIPPKIGASKLSASTSQSTSQAVVEENWMYVMSPREVHGAKGPFPVDDMRYLYRMGEISDSTLVWTEGQPKWEKIGQVAKLKYQLITLPEIPSKKASELQITMDNPIPPSPTKEEALACEKMENVNKFHLANSCSRCGSVAVGHAVGQAEQLPDLSLIAGNAINFNIKFVSEIIPGFLWIGNHAASRIKYLSHICHNLLF
jgi:hypothetical protein